MSDPIMSRLLELEKKHNAIIDTTAKLFENQSDMIMAVDKKYELVRTLLTEVLELMKNQISKETTK
jgi:hypothetical protein